MDKKREEGKGEEGIRKTISFGRKAKEIIEAYRRNKENIPSFTQAVNEIIEKSK